MPLHEIKGVQDISYIVLKDYHFTAKQIYDLKEEKSESQDVPFEFSLYIESDKIDDSITEYMEFQEKLADLGVWIHMGHLIYITQHLVAYEGAFNEQDGRLNDKIIEYLLTLKRLLTIKETSQYNGLHLELTHKLNGKDFDNYINIKDTSIIAVAVNALIEQQITIIKDNTSLYSGTFDELMQEGVISSANEVQTVINKLSNISKFQFESLLRYTIAKRLQEYTNKYTDLNPNGAFLTNDQLRVIYAVFKINNLIPVEHEVERDAINYMRMVITNKGNTETMDSNWIINDDETTD